MKTISMLFEKIISDKFLKKISILSIILWWWLQVIWLISISPWYLRFFSISQMASDSIMLFLSYILLSCPYYITYYSIDKDKRKNMWNVFQEFALFYISTFLIILITNPYSFQSPLLHFFYPSSFYEWFYYVFIIIWIIVLFLTLIKLLSLDNFIIKISKVILKTPIIQNILLFPTIFIIIYLWIWLMKNINDNLLIPDSFLNKEFICNYTTENNCKIRYFNDKYIFVERENDKIEVLKFDNFFR